MPSLDYYFDHNHFWISDGEGRRLIIAERYIKNQITICPDDLFKVLNKEQVLAFAIWLKEKGMA